MRVRAKDRQGEEERERERERERQRTVSKRRMETMLLVEWMIYGCNQRCLHSLESILLEHRVPLSDRRVHQHPREVNEVQ